MPAPSQPHHSHAFVPALGRDWLTPLYDPFIRATLRERAVKSRLVDQARLQPGQRVLDFGCGTGTLTLLLKRAQPSARVTGLDVDAKVLELARRKIEKAGAEVELLQGRIEEVELAAASFDRVVSCLVLHHLTTDEKLSALRAMRSALRPGGELHIADFGPPHNALMRWVSWPVRMLDGAARLSANLSGQLPTLIGDAGFVDVRDRGSVATPFGTLAFWSAGTGGSDAPA